MEVDRVEKGYWKRKVKVANMEAGKLVPGALAVDKDVVEMEKEKGEIKENYFPIGKVSFQGLC